MSLEALIARLEALEAERRASTGAESLIHELRADRRELELENQALRDAQAQLEAARARLSGLYDLAPVAYLTLDREARIVEANLAAATMLGLDRGLLLGKPFATLARFDDPAPLYAHVRRCIERAAPIVSELRFATALGLQEVRALSTPVIGRDGAPEAARTALVDAREVRKTERDLERARAAEASLRRRLEQVARADVAINEAITRMQHGDVVAVLQVLADQACAVTGARYAAVGVGTADNRQPERWVFSGMAAELEPTLGAAMRAIGRLDDIARARRPARMRDLCTNSALTAAATQAPPITSLLGAPFRRAGRSVGALVVVNRYGNDDFTDADELAALMLSERAAIAVEIAQMLGRERSRSQLLHDAARAFAQAFDLDSTFGAIARLAVPTFGDACAVELLDGEGQLRIAATHHRDPSRRAELARLRDTPSQLPADVTTRLWTEGLPRRFAVAPRGARPIGAQSTLLVPLRYDGVALGLLHLAFDRVAADCAHSDDDVVLAAEFAHRAALAVQNARLHDTAQRAVVARDELLSFVSHDLGNFLNSIVLNAERAAHTTPAGTARAAPYIDSIRRASARMASLLQSLRDAAMMEAGRFTIAPKHEEVRPLVAEACAMVRAGAEAKHLELELRIVDDLPAVALDRERFHQVLANLLRNAIEHTPEHGKIVVVAAPWTGRAAVRVAVSDTGPGVPESDLPYLFDRYWRKDPAARTGSGLGLFIAKGIVNAHGGELWVESQEGAGATFSFTLPAVAQARPKSVKPAPEPGMRPT
jgi:PAS domain S-box-containing protein